MQFRIKLFLLFCFLLNSGFYVQAMSPEKTERLRYLLRKARERRVQYRKFQTPLGSDIQTEETGVLPVTDKSPARPDPVAVESIETSPVPERIPEPEIVVEPSPVIEEPVVEVIEEKPAPIIEEKKPVETIATKEEELIQQEDLSYDELVSEFNKLFDETKTNVAHKEELVHQKHEEQIQEHKKESPAPVPSYKKEKPKVITKTTKKPVSPAPVVVKKEPEVKVETKNKVAQNTTETKSVSESSITKKEEVAKVDLIDNGLDSEAKEEASEKESAAAKEAKLAEEKTKKEAVEEREAEDKKEDEQIAKNKAKKEKEHLDVVASCLKSLEEDAWNEVNYNMDQALQYFSKEKQLADSPKDVEKFYRMTMGFQHFAKGGLELDQGDFADFEKAETHYLNCRDILEEVELRLGSNSETDKYLLKVIQTVKKYINEDIEYIEEMIDLS